MASDAIFHMFPEPGEQQGDGDVNKISEVDRFVQKHYPMLYLNLNANPDQPSSVVDVQYENEGAACPLCELDRNTLDSIKVLKPNQVKVNLESYDYKFTEEQVNIHLAHTVRDENGSPSAHARTAGVMVKASVASLWPWTATAPRATCALTTARG